MNKRLLVFLVLAALLLAAVPAFAQEVTETATPDFTPTAEATEVVTPAPTDVPPIEEPPEDTPVTEPQTLLGQIYALLADGTYILWAAAGVVIIVGLIKVVANAIGIKIEGQGAVLLTLVIQVLVWLGYAIANYFGQGETFQKNYLILVDIGRSLLPLAGSIFAGQVFYKAAAKRDTPVLGFSVNRKPQ